MRYLGFRGKFHRSFEALGGSRPSILDNPVESDRTWIHPHRSPRGDSTPHLQAFPDRLYIGPPHNPSPY